MSYLDDDRFRRFDDGDHDDLEDDQPPAFLQVVRWWCEAVVGKEEVAQVTVITRRGTRVTIDLPQR